MSMAQFFDMGGYAAYVWGAYGFALVMLMANLALPHRDFKRRLRELQRTQGKGNPS